MWCCVAELLRNIRTQVLIKLIKPYTRIHIPFISKVSTHDQNNILHSQLIFYLYFFIFRQSFDLYWNPISHISLNKIAELEEGTMKITHVQSQVIDFKICSGFPGLVIWELSMCQTCRMICYTEPSRKFSFQTVCLHYGKFLKKMPGSWFDKPSVNHLPPSHSWQSQSGEEWKYLFHEEKLWILFLAVLSMKCSLQFSCNWCYSSYANLSGGHRFSFQTNCWVSQWSSHLNQTCIYQ